MAVKWGYYNAKRFEEVDNKYLPPMGEGDTMATQIVTAVNKLVYKWYNDGDVFDNTAYLSGWCNDLSSYANWLYENLDRGVQDILYGVFDAGNDDYEDLLKELADRLLDASYLETMDGKKKTGSIYDCTGPFRFLDDAEEEDDEDWADWEDEEWED